MSDTREPTGQGSPDEIAVTEVSEEVRRELSQLFRTADTTPEDGLTSSPTADSGSEDDTPTESPTASWSATRGVAGDALIDPTSEHDVVQIVEDMPDTLVIDADEVDRVVIVDDDRPDPSFEERQRKRARRDRRRRVRWVKIALVSAAVLVLGLAVLSSSIFAIRTVDVEGNVYTSPETVDGIVKSLTGKSVFTVDTKGAREIALADPWVADVRISTSYSGSALVEIAERVPVVWYSGPDQKARVVDARGHVVTVLDGWPTQYLQVRGTGPALDAGAVADDVYRAAAQLVLALPDEVRPRVKALEVSDAGELSMLLKTGTQVRFGPPTDLQNKLVAVVVLLRRQDPATLAVIDVSTGEPTVQTK